MAILSGVWRPAYVRIRLSADSLMAFGFKTKKASVMISSPSESLNNLGNHIRAFDWYQVESDTELGKAVIHISTLQFSTIFTSSRGGQVQVSP